MSKKQHISAEMKANIADALAGGLSYAMIADRYGVSYSTIQRVRSAVINGEEFIAKKEVPKVHDTPTEKKKSPETVSTPIEPVTEDITDSGNPADTNIITDVPENVKQEEIPGVVVDALLEKIQNISEKIETEEKYLAALKADKKSLERWYHENCTAFGRDYKRRNDHAAR